MSLNQIFIFAALASVVLSAPLDQGTNAEALRQSIRQIDSQVIAAFNCQGRNCTMAELSGSTGDMGLVQTRIRTALECRGQSCLIADTAGSTG
jgi:hypothetical protein